MSEFIEVTEDVTIIETDDDHVEVIEAGVPGPQGPQGDPATNLVTSVAGGTGDVTLEDMGLDLVDNTSDVDKPVSTLQQAALNTKATKLDMPQFSIPVRDGSQAGNGEANAYRAYAIAAGNNSVAVRGATGTLQATTASAANDLTTRAQMDAADALKQDLISMPAWSVVARNAAGVGGITASGIRFAATPDASTLVQRDTGGQVRTGAPILSDAATPKSFVDALIQKGTGFPNGVVAAPVGSIYIDTAVTAGAISWMKKSGTGNTGWEVENGDTGWRNISYWGTDGVVNGAALPTGVSPTTAIAGAIQIRRSNATVEWRIVGAAFTGLAAFNIPTGFGVGGIFKRIPTLVNSVHTYMDLGSSQAFVGVAGQSIGQWYGITAIYDTTIAWPTTLPGTAA